MANGIKCPKCGSEDIQYATNTSSGGISMFQSCCGFLLMGPLGLLCGACGSGTSTEEFWVCKSCGNKFSNREGKRALENEIAAEKQAEINKQKAYEAYCENKKIKGNVIKEYGNIVLLEKTVNAAAKDEQVANKKYFDSKNKFIESSTDSKVKKLNKKSENYERNSTIFMWIGIILAVISFVLGLFPLGIAIVVIGFILLVIREMNNPIEKLDNIYQKISPEGKALQEEKAKAKAKYDELYKILKSCKDCDKYEKENPDKIPNN